jgi:Peptidase M15
MSFLNGLKGFLFGYGNRDENAARAYQPYTPPKIVGGKSVITLEDYWQGRDIEYFNELNEEIRQNASDLLWRVNGLLKELNIVSVKVVSGWRPASINKKVGGASRSYHISGQAVDLRDNSQQEFSRLLIKNNHLLTKHGLWLENPNSTRGNTNWVHLDTGSRNSVNGERVFEP